MEQKSTPPLAGGGISSTHHDHTCTASPAPRTSANRDGESRKQIRILGIFATGAVLTRFTAEPLGDHCLPSTISSLQRRYSLTFRRELREVPNRFGRRTHVMAYWLEGEQIEKAAKVVLRETRGTAGGAA